MDNRLQKMANDILSKIAHCVLNLKHTRLRLAILKTLLAIEAESINALWGLHIVIQMFLSPKYHRDTFFKFTNIDFFSISYHRNTFSIPSMKRSDINSHQSIEIGFATAFVVIWVVNGSHLVLQMTEMNACLQGLLESFFSPSPSSSSSSSRCLLIFYERRNSSSQITIRAYFR